MRQCKGKFEAVAKDIAERHRNGQPVLVGTVAIETSEIISKLLTKYKIPHNVLNAKTMSVRQKSLRMLVTKVR